MNTTIATRAAVLEDVPASTIEWLLAEENPAVAVLTRRTLLGEPDDDATRALWARRNDYAPVATILSAMLEDGSWAPPARDYAKYGGTLWQIHFLGELCANGDDERVQRAARHAFERQLDDGSFSAGNMQAAASIPCLTANVGRALARLVGPDDPHVLEALGYCTDLFAKLGIVDCREGRLYQLNGYCHMLTTKLLLFLGEVPEELWPDGAVALRDECVRQLRDKSVLHCLPEESRAFNDLVWSTPASGRHGLRETFLAEHPELHYKAKPGWLRFGFPLSYNSDALEALVALRAVGEPLRPEFADAIALVRKTTDPESRWVLKNTFNGKMLADVETKGRPSRWLTLRALQVLEHFGEPAG